MWASDVLPSPGGPASSTWSSGSPRRLRGLDEDRELSRHLLLVDELLEARGAQRAVELLVDDLCRAGVADARREDRGVANGLLRLLVLGAHAALAPLVLASAALRSAAATSSSALSPSTRSSSFSASAGV